MLGCCIIPPTVLHPYTPTTPIVRKYPVMVTMQGLTTPLSVCYRIQGQKDKSQCDNGKNHMHALFCVKLSKWVNGEAMLCNWQCIGQGCIVFNHLVTVDLSQCHIWIERRAFNLIWLQLEPSGSMCWCNLWGWFMIGFPIYFYDLSKYQYYIGTNNTICPQWPCMVFIREIHYLPAVSHPFPRQTKHIIICERVLNNFWHEMQCQWYNTHPCIIASLPWLAKYGNSSLQVLNSYCI